MAFHFLGLSEQSQIFLNSSQLLDFLIRRFALQHADRYSTRCSSHLVHFYRYSLVRRSRFCIFCLARESTCRRQVVATSYAKKDHESSRPVVSSSIWSAKHSSVFRWVDEKRQPTKLPYKHRTADSFPVWCQTTRRWHLHSFKLYVEHKRTIVGHVMRNEYRYRCYRGLSLRSDGQVEDLLLGGRS